MKLHEIVREGAEKLHDLKCVNGAMYFGSVETPCSGRDTGECCLNEQTNEEACAELDNYFKQSQLSLLEAVKEMVEKPSRTAPQLDIYLDVVKNGNKDDMYDLGYNQALSDISTTLSEEINLIKGV